jgi:hypothetical protein
MLLTAAIACLGEDAPCQFFMPALISNWDKPQLLEHWFTARLPTDGRLKRLVEDVGWYSAGMLFMAAILTHELDTSLATATWEQAKTILSTEPPGTLLIEGIRDNDVAAVAGDPSLIEAFLREAEERDLYCDDENK